MILLWGNLDDKSMAMAHAALVRAGAEFTFLEHRKIFTSDIDCVFDPENGARCTVTVGGDTIDIARVKVAYVRGSNFYDYDDLRDLPTDTPLAMRAALFAANLIAWLDSSDALVINPAGPSATNNSKPYQLAVIGQAGFAVPETLISNDPHAVNAFLSDNPDSIYKSVSGFRSIVRKVGDAQRSFIGDVNWCPTLFQRFLPGTNYRAHVLNGEVLAVRIESDQVDYRCGRATITPTELPADVAERCRRLNEMFGLRFSGIDLMRTPEDDWYCFEVNTMPAYSYFEIGSGQAISTALARFMMAADAA